ncbi:unnamed protein product [Closterium sp. Naga37s-1]|nr:unnamed protein product [Closterium sp. Naga37s-1]
MQAREPIGERGRGGRRKRVGEGKRGNTGVDGEVDGEEGEEEGEEGEEDGEEGGGEEEGEVEEEGEMDVSGEGNAEEEEGREEKAEDGGTEEDDAEATALLAKADVSLSATATCDSFADLALAPWLVATCHEMGLRHPTPVQCACIPPVVAGSNVIGVAQTGSGKTAAFALPILQFLVLDEADRLLDRGFEEEIGAILGRMPKERQTLLFSATFTANLHALKVCGGSMGIAWVGVAWVGVAWVGVAWVGVAWVGVAWVGVAWVGVAWVGVAWVGVAWVGVAWVLHVRLALRLHQGEALAALLCHFHRQPARLEGAMSKTKKLFHFEAYEGFKTVEALDQTYLFLPSNVRDVYLCRLLSRLLPSLQTILPPAPPPSASAAARPPVRSVIVFTSSCQ